MKKNSNNKTFKHKIFNFLFIILCLSSPKASLIASDSHQINLSFDSLFYATWYQKAVELTLSVWQTLAQVFEKNDEIPYEILLGKLSYAYFCVNRMQQEKVVSLADDTAYFMTALRKIQDLFSFIAIHEKNYDFIVCAQEIISLIQKSFYSPVSDSLKPDTQ